MAKKAITHRIAAPLLRFMPRIPARDEGNLLPKFTLRAALALTLFFAIAAAGAAARAQGAFAALKPPPGSRVALIEFDDLECPFCARENPVLKEASAKYHIPWIRHDFPIPYHNWSFQAAVNARWFDAHPKHLGNDYRDAVFASQSSIETLNDLRQFTDKFAQQHGVAFPFAVDPQGKLSNAVKADAALGRSLGVHETPTVWIVTDRSGGAAPYTQVTDFSKLYVMLDAITAQAGHSRR